MLSYLNSIQWKTRQETNNCRRQWNVWWRWKSKECTSCQAYSININFGLN